MVVMWDEQFKNKIKSYPIQQSQVANNTRLSSDNPAVRALSLGQDCILVGTKNSEVSQDTPVEAIFRFLRLFIVVAAYRSHRELLSIIYMVL